MTGHNSISNCILVTGAAGFIGFHCTRKLLLEGYRVVGIDNMNDYYEPQLKYHRLGQLGIKPNHIEAIPPTTAVISDTFPQFTFYRIDIKDNNNLSNVFKKEKPNYVIHLAAQVGVRYSLENPNAYIDSNIIGFINILENCRHNAISHLVFSSSSSVYGASRNMPYSEHHSVDHPISLYAATKKSNELMAHSYSHLYHIPITGLRFFTVYGPWGRPDMAYYIFAHKIMKNIPVEMFNNGNMKRDFTYIDDIVDGIEKVMLKIPVPDPSWDENKPDPASSSAPYRIFNIGNNHPVDLFYFLQLIESNLGKTAIKKFSPLQNGDVLDTYADINSLYAYTGFKPTTSLERGIAIFTKWFKEYHGYSDKIPV